MGLSPAIIRVEWWLWRNGKERDFGPEWLSDSLGSLRLAGRRPTRPRHLPHLASSALF
jgi:hypothetical protein